MGKEAGYQKPVGCFLKSLCPHLVWGLGKYQECYSHVITASSEALWFRCSVACHAGGSARWLAGDALPAQQSVVIPFSLPLAGKHTTASWAMMTAKTQDSSAV